MAKLKMELVSVFGGISDRENVLDTLQRLGVMDIETTLLDEEVCATPEGYSLDETAEKAAELERQSQSGANALKFLNERFPQKKGLLASFSGRRVVSDEQTKTAEGNIEEYAAYCKRILEIERLLAETNADTLRQKNAIEQLLIYEGLDVPLDFEGTASTAAFIGSVSGTYTLEELLSAISAQEGAPDFYAEIVAKSAEQTFIFATCKKEDNEALSKALRSLGFARVAQSEAVCAAEKIKALDKKCEENDALIKELLAELEGFCDKREGIELYVDTLSVLSQKLKITGDICRTAHTFMIKGYVASVDLEKLKQALEAYTVLIESEPADEEKAPVKLKNGRFSTPGEVITEMYSLPGASDIDPSPLTGFFYYLFFGMMLADLGYGILLALGSWLLKKKFKPEAAMSKNLTLFMYCGISTAIWGIIYGSFFGDFLTVFSETFLGTRITLPALLDPMNGDAVTLLILSLILGFVQIMAGLIAKAVVCIKNKDYLGALFDAGCWIVTLLGLAMLAGSFVGIKILGTIGMWTAITGAVGLVLTQGRDKKGIGKLISGLASLYDITGYVSDLLSFSRLMALGLTSAAMAAVFNKIGALAGKGVIGAALMLVMFILGHAINIGLNALGAYVHTLRLQYVELFSKFYEGGGREFKPFTRKSKFTRLD